MHNRLVLVADDEDTIRESLCKVLGEHGFKVVSARDGLQASRLLEEKDVAVALLDIRMPEMDGLRVLTRAREVSPETQVIMITAFGTVENAVEAVKLGANDYITKPFVFDDILLKIDRALGVRRLAEENRALRTELQGRNGLRDIVGTSAALRRALSMVNKLAQTRSTALITGESGTGKELIARAIHYNGITRDARFVPVNCAALPETLVESELFGHTRGAFTGAGREKLGLFEMADAGTIFLDEICSMPLSAQAKLLRAVEEKQILPIGGTEPTEVNVRVLCAANCDLAGEVEAGRFREDVYYRLNVVEIHLPPLRERREDIAPLALHFAEMFSRDLGKPFPGVSDAVLRAMTEYAWPGNVRELKNVIERAIILGDGRPIDLEDMTFVTGRRVPAGPDGTGADLKSALRTAQTAHILHVLRVHDFDKVATAQALDIGLSSLYRKMEELGISPPEDKTESLKSKV